MLMARQQVRVYKPYYNYIDHMAAVYRMPKPIDTIGYKLLLAQGQVDT